jgi:hypothetical protein
VQRLKMQRPMDYDESSASQALDTAETLTAAQRQ